MDAEKQKMLRAPFPPERISQIPRKTKSGATVRLDYVGHADVTDRLLAVDPAWTWEPVTPEEYKTLPPSNGLWIKLTVCGVTRYGFGDAQGKTGGDATKEMIGDAIRNAAMRFGVALDLWSKSDPDAPLAISEPEPAKTDPDWLRDAGIGLDEAKTREELEIAVAFIADGVKAGKCSPESRADLLAKFEARKADLA